MDYCKSCRNRKTENECVNAYFFRDSWSDPEEVCRNYEETSMADEKYLVSEIRKLVEEQKVEYAKGFENGKIKAYNEALEIMSPYRNCDGVEDCYRLTKELRDGKR